MSTIIVGVDATERSVDATAFARDVARRTGSRIVLAAAYAYAPVPARVSGAQVEQFLGDDARQALARAREALDGMDADERTIADPLPARALHGLARELAAGLIVVGSSHRSGLRRVLLGSTAVRVVHASPCAVAVVPRAYAAAEHRFARIGCAVDGSPQSEMALSAAVAAATRMGARVRAIRAFDPTSVEESGSAAAHAARAELDRWVAAHAAQADVQAVLIEGLAGQVLSKQSEDLDLLFAGSRGLGPERGVLLGSVTQHILGDAGCPVIVTPPSLEAGAEDIFAAEVAST